MNRQEAWGAVEAVVDDLDTSEGVYALAQEGLRQLRAEDERLRREVAAFRDDYLVPDGAERLEAYRHNGEVIVLGSLPDEEDEDHPRHNCDTMGCSSAAAHVLLRQNGSGTY